MKRVVSLFIAMTMIISAMCFPLSTSAATEYVTVYLNEKAIDFPTTDARPQIFSNRTYVPVRKTCEVLGLSIDWNSKTETLTFNRDGIVISHTMRSAIVYVNGEAVRFDTPSINKNNRTLMPIRMLAESIGATVTWDNPTRSVHITTNDSTTITPTTPTATGVAVNSITADKTVVNNGDKVTFTAVANSATEKVKFMNLTANSELGEVTECVANNDGTKTFIFEHDCVNDTGDQLILNVQAVPGTSAAYTDSASAMKSTGVIISAEKSSSDNESSKDYKSDYMISCKALNSKVQTDSYARIRVKTTDDIKRVKITNTANKRDVEIEDYEEDDDDNRTFEGKVEMTKEGETDLRVYLYVSKDKEYEDVYETLTVDVDDDYDEEDEEYDELEIIDLWTNNSFAYRGYETVVYVKTSTDVDYLELLREGESRGNGLTRSAKTSKTSGYYYWEFPFTVKSKGEEKYTLVAYNEDEDYVTESFRLEGRAFDKDDPVVVNVEQKDSTVTEGEDVNIRIICSSGTDKVKITRGTSHEVFSEELNGSKSDETRNVNATFKIDDIEADYYITPYKNGDAGERYKFKMTGDVYSKIEVIDFDFDDDSTIREGDMVDLTVTTSNSCEKLWVEQREDRVSAIYRKPTREKNGNYIWEIQFSPIDSGRKTYTIVAEGEDEEQQDYEDFSISVKSS